MLLCVFFFARLILYVSFVSVLVICCYVLFDVTLCCHLSFYLINDVSVLSHLVRVAVDEVEDGAGQHGLPKPMKSEPPIPN